MISLLFFTRPSLAERDASIASGEISGRTWGIPWSRGHQWDVDVLPGLESRVSGLGGLTLPVASCFTALCGQVCPSYRRSTGV
ncbi:hypothetical protein GCM10010121_094660 [Streptomyces brasiliensis]|uniref:Uncharacterized protein n=1 Tax=Streptomyces brasiliensis TaxID=1954 RepID=A0A917UML6_9ACTN|nr:hypothetical protein GCM10010121_094660 [Streptomyces brasiliensis]